MYRLRLGLALKLVAGTLLAGLGHVFIVFQRETYPLDGYACYAAAALLFGWAIRSSRGASVEWRALREPIEGVIRELRRLVALRAGPASLPGVIALNVVSAGLAIVLGSWIALVGWGLSLVWLFSVTWPHGSISAAAIRPTASMDVLTEAAEVPPRQSSSWLGVAAGVLVVVAGHMLLGVESPVPFLGVFGDLAESIGAPLKLMLPGGSAPALLGLLGLAAGGILFASATRGAAIVDRARVIVESHRESRAYRSGGWLVVAVAGLALWLVSVVSAANGGIGLGPAALWVAGLALVGWVWRKIDYDRGVRLGVSLERPEALGLAAMMVVVSGVWLLQLDHLPASIWPDEGAYWTFARDVAVGTAPVNLFGLGVYGFPAGGSVYQAMWIGLLGQTVWVWRFGSVIAVLASTVPLFLMARSLLGRRVAFVSVAFFGTSPFVLAYGRTGYQYALSILPVMLSAAFVVAAIRRDSRFYAFLAGVSSGAGFLLYPSSRFGIALCAAIWLTFLFTRMARDRSAVRVALALGAAWLFAASPAIAYGLSREPEAYVDKLFDSSMANVLYAESVYGRDTLLARAIFASTRDNQLFFEPSMLARLALRGWVRTWIGLHQSGLSTEHYVVGPLAGPLAIFYILGLAWCLARARRPGYLVWPIWLFAGTFLLSAIETFPPHTPDLLPAVPALAALAAVGLVGLLDALPQSWPTLSTRFATGVLVAATIALSGLSLRAYFVEMPQRYKPSLEMVMFWSALELPRGSTIVFVRDDAYPPDFVPWGLQHFNTGVAWQMIDVPGASHIDWRATCQSRCRIFYAPSIAGAIEAQAREALGAGSVTPYTNETGDLIGLAFTPAAKP